MRKSVGILWTVAVIVGCGTSKLFDAVPSGINKEKIPKQTIEMTAERFHFTPEVVKVKEGTLVTLKLTALDGTHGFALDAFGIDEELEEKKPKTVEFYAVKKGEYKFHCSHICGIGHLGMSGKVIVE